MRTIRVMLTLNKDELAKIDAKRGFSPRATWIRERAVGEAERAEDPPRFRASFDESIEILSQMAREGKVSAAIALAKELRTLDGNSDEDEKPQDWFDELSTRRQAVSSCFARFCDLLRVEDGSQLVLHEFQKRFLRDYFGGTRETLVLLPKKNGKSTIIAALALYQLLVVRDAECVIAAASRDQATIILGQARKFIRWSPELQQRVKMNQRQINHLRNEGRIRVLASDEDTADGVIPTLAIVDELHRHKSSALYGVFRDGLGPRRGRMITISTAGDDEESPLGLMREKAYQLEMRRDGAYRFARSLDGGYVMHE